MLLGWSSITSFLLLFTLKVSLAASVDTDEFWKRVKRRWPILFGVVCQFVISPACGALTVWFLNISFVPGVVLLIVTSCPGGCFSNWLCQLVNGDLALSVAMTGWSTLAGVFLLPLNVAIYTKLLYSTTEMSIHHWRSLLFSVLTVLGALILGLLLSRRLNSHKWRERFSNVGTLCGMLLFLLSVVASTNPASSTTPLWRKPAYVYVAVLVPVLMSMSLVAGLSSLERLGLFPPERVAVVIEAVYQNTALAATTAMQMFPGRQMGDAVSITVLFQLAQAIALLSFGILAHYSNWTLASPKETLWSALMNNFQLDPTNLSFSPGPAEDYGSIAGPGSPLGRPWGHPLRAPYRIRMQQRQKMGDGQRTSSPGIASTGRSFPSCRAVPALP